MRGAANRDDPGTSRYSPRVYPFPRAISAATLSTSGGSSTAWLARRASTPGERALVVAELELGELEPVRGRDDDDALVAARRRPRSRSLKSAASATPVCGHVYSPVAVGARGRVGELVLGRLLDDAVHRLRAPPSRAARSPGCRSGSRSRASSRRAIGRRPSSFPATKARYSGFGVRRLRDAEARQARDDAELLHHAGSRRRARPRCRGCRSGGRPSRAPPSRTAATISMATVFCPSMRSGFIEFAR